MKPLARYGLLLTLAIAIAAGDGATSARAQGEEWVIRSFDARYVLDQGGTFAVTEEIAVDFGSLQRHGIFRDIPVEYSYDRASTA